MRKKILSMFPLPVAVILIAVWQLYFQPLPARQSNDAAIQQQASNETAVSNPKLSSAYEKRVTKFQVKGQGVVIKLLKDDMEGSRHQRILLKVNKNQTVLIAHNIDLAARIDNIQVGELLEFDGEYVWNNKGGVVHWTHKDPRGKHVAGWLKYQGKLYQ